MQNQLEQRLKKLTAEFKSGQETLAELDAKRISVQKTMVETSGAIQALKDEIKNQHKMKPFNLD